MLIHPGLTGSSSGSTLQAPSNPQRTCVKQGVGGDQRAADVHPRAQQLLVLAIRAVQPAAVVLRAVSVDPVLCMQASSRTATVRVWQAEANSREHQAMERRSHTSVEALQTQTAAAAAQTKAKTTLNPQAIPNATK